MGKQETSFAIGNEHFVASENRRRAADVPLETQCGKFLGKDTTVRGIRGCSQNTSGKRMAEQGNAGRSCCSVQLCVSRGLPGSEESQEGQPQQQRARMIPWCAPAPSQKKRARVGTRNVKRGHGHKMGKKKGRRCSTFACLRWRTSPLSVQPDGTRIVPDARAVVGEELHGRQTLVRGPGLIATALLGGAAHGNPLGQERGTCCGTHRHDLLFLKRDGSVCALRPESTAGMDGRMVAENPALLKLCSPRSASLNQGRHCPNHDPIPSQNVRNGTRMTFFRN